MNHLAFELDDTAILGTKKMGYKRKDGGWMCYINKHHFWHLNHIERAWLFQ